MKNFIMRIKRNFIPLFARAIFLKTTRGEKPWQQQQHHVKQAVQKALEDVLQHFVAWAKLKVGVFYAGLLSLFRI